MTLIRRIDRNWYEGRIGHRKGIFPASYVEVAQEPTGPGNERGEGKRETIRLIHGKRVRL